MIAQLQPARCLIVLPPVYRPKVGERVQFELCCYGKDRPATGIVTRIDHIAPVIEYECLLPSEEQCRADYRYPFTYPADGVQRGEIQLPLEQIRPYDGEQLSINDRAEITHDAIATLEAERDRLLSEGEIAPVGAWIECGGVSGRPGWRQAVWRAESRAFIGRRSGNPTSHQYIGREGSDKHKRAIAAYNRRKQLERITKQLEILEGLSDV